MSKSPMDWIATHPVLAGWLAAFILTAVQPIEKCDSDYTSLLLVTCTLLAAEVMQPSTRHGKELWIIPLWDTFRHDVLRT